MEDIATLVMRYLAENNIAEMDTISSSGNLYHSQMPDGDGVADIAIAVTPTGSAKIETYNSIDRPTVQILVRGDDNPKTSLNLANKIYNLFQGKRRYYLYQNEGYVMRTECLQQPYLLNIDGKNRYHYVFNILFEMRNEAR